MCVCVRGLRWSVARRHRHEIYDDEKMKNGHDDYLISDDNNFELIVIFMSLPSASLMRARLYALPHPLVVLSRIIRGRSSHDDSMLPHEPHRTCDCDCDSCHFNRTFINVFDHPCTVRRGKKHTHVNPRRQLECECL